MGNKHRSLVHSVTCSVTVWEIKTSDGSAQKNDKKTCELEPPGNIYGIITATQTTPGN